MTAVACEEGRGARWPRDHTRGGRWAGDQARRQLLHVCIKCTQHKKCDKPALSILFVWVSIVLLGSSNSRLECLATSQNLRLRRSRARAMEPGRDLHLRRGVHAGPLRVTHQRARGRPAARSEKCCVRQKSGFHKYTYKYRGQHHHFLGPLTLVGPNRIVPNHALHRAAVPWISPQALRSLVIPLVSKEKSRKKCLCYLFQFQLRVEIVQKPSLFRNSRGTSGVSVNVANFCALVGGVVYVGRLKQPAISQRVAFFYSRDQFTT